MHIFLLLLLFEVYTPATVTGSNYGDAGSSVHSSHNALVEEEEEYYTPRLDYKNPQWCHTLSLSNGEVTCFSPRGGNYRSTLGTRCEMSCDPGYRLLGRSSLMCLPSRRWSGTAYCRQLRCRVLPLVYHGTYSCTKGVVVSSRCDYICDPGYQLEGDRSRICLEGGRWAGVEPSCVDREAPKIQCPLSRVRVADLGELTTRVTWDKPVVKDSADVSLTDLILVGASSGSTFKEGIHVIRYKVYDQARNMAACKFIVRVDVRRCPVLQAPLHGHLMCTADGNNYGAECEYQCEKGYELQGDQIRLCQFDRTWSGDAVTCVMKEISAQVRTAGALLDQFYERRRLLIVSAPSSNDEYYKLQNLMLERSDCGLGLRKVTVVELLGEPPQETGRMKEKILDSQVIEELRQALRISRSYFSMVLLDKRGVDRERFMHPASLDELYHLIDSYVLSEEEREQLEKYRNLCD